MKGAGWLPLFLEWKGLNKGTVHTWGRLYFDDL